MRLFDIIQQGGYIMYPLVIFSVLAWTIGLYKIFFLKDFNKKSRALSEKVKGALASGSPASIKNVTSGESALLTNPYDVVADESYSSKEEMAENLERRVIETQTGLAQGLWILGSITSSAPFIGLFGTVMGIMESFKSIGLSGKSGFSVVSAGISESLIATAAGIMVAVIALLFYNFLQTRVNLVSQEFKHRLEDAAELRFRARKLKA